MLNDAPRGRKPAGHPRALSVAPEVDVEGREAEPEEGEVMDGVCVWTDECDPAGLSINMDRTL
jgi:hypothetical protein